MWTVGIANLRPGQVSVRSGNHLIQKSGSWAAFIPPFNMVNWQLSAGALHWQAYLSIAPLPEFLSDRAFAFPWDSQWAPQSVDDLFAILKGVQTPEYINDQHQQSGIALRAKQFIDRTFRDPEVGVTEVAEALNVSHSFMTREFKKAFGLTPVSYRTKLRVFESTKLMLMSGYNVTTAGHEVGFTDTARFNKQFRNLMNTIPSQFCLEKRLKRGSS